MQFNPEHADPNTSGEAAGREDCKTVRVSEETHRALHGVANYVEGQALKGKVWARELMPPVTFDQVIRHLIDCHLFCVRERERRRK